MEKVLALLLLSLSLNADFAVKSFYEERNKNLVRQKYEASCGASAVATLLNMSELKKLDENDILKLIEGKTDMLSFLELQDILTKLSYKSKAYKLNRTIFEKLSLPIIVKVENDPKFPHFVVVWNTKGDFVQVYDPSFGFYLSLKSIFYSLWDKDRQGGYALLVEPKLKLHKMPSLPSKVFFIK